MKKSRPGTLVGALALSLTLLLGCDAQEPPTPTPVATAVPPIPLNATSGAIRASGNVVPAQAAELSFAVAGPVTEVLVTTGADVDADAPLIRLNPTTAAAAVEEARARLFQAQAARQEIIDGPRAQEVEIAQAQLDAAQARLAQLAESARPGDVEAARAAVRAAQSAYQQLFSGPQEEVRIAALAELTGAEAARRQAQSAYNEVSWQSNVGMLPESRALEEATINLEAAQARYDALFADPAVAEIAAAQARVAQAEAQLERLLSPGSANEVAEATAQVRSAQAQLNLLTNGTTNSVVATAAMAVTQAEAALARAEAALATLTLRAPFAGSVAALHISVGEMAQPGEVVLVLADLADLRVETTDLSERDVARVRVGQPARVYVEALDQEFAGRVTQIAPQADVLGGDVVYGVTIALDVQPPALRWGMSADVEILDE